MEIKKGVLPPPSHPGEAPPRVGPRRERKDGAPADRLDHPLAQNPYAGVGGQAQTSAAIAKRYDRPGLAAENPLATRLLALASGQKLTGSRQAILDAAAGNAHLAGAVGKMPDGTPIPSVEALFPKLSGRALGKARAEAERALAAFPVQRADGGGRTTLLSRLEAQGFSEAQTRRVLGAFTAFHHSLGLRHFDAAGSDVNWKHICSEAAQVLDACSHQGLSAAEAEVAVLGSIFSDAVKFGPTLLTHNVDGAVGAYHVMQRFCDLDEPADAALVAAVVQVAREHQIGPPSFMAMIAGFQIMGALKARGEDPAAHQATIQGLQAKMSDPLGAGHVEVDPSGAARVAFTETERALLSAIGISEWSVPHPDAPWFKASMAVITGDSTVNYAMPDGVGKIVALSGPGSMFKDATVFHSMYSCGVSAVDAARVVPEDYRPIYEAGQRYTRGAIDEVAAWLHEQLATGFLPFDAAELELIAKQDGVDLSQLGVVREGGRAYVQVPGDPEDVAFVHRPLDYDKPGPELELARLVKRKVADLLRDHQAWMPPASGEGA